MRTTVQVTAAAILAAAIAASTARAAGEQAELSMPFKATTLATPTGLTMDLRYLNPQDREGKPPTVSELAIHLPPGTRIDPTALPACEASDEEIRARGGDACPPETLVGTGKLDVYLGAPGDPQSTDLLLFNGPGQLIEVLLFEGTNTAAAHERLFIEGATFRASTAQVPPGAPPERRFSASHIVWDVPANGEYLVTPAACPEDGVWRTVGEFSFADGTSDTAEGTQACSSSSSAPSTFTVDAAPRALTRGRETPVRVQLRSSDPGCLEGAVVRVGRRAATTDAEGTATLRALVRWGRPYAHLRVLTTRCGRSALPIIIKACRRPPSRRSTRSTPTRSRSTTRGRRASPSRCT